VAFSYRPFNLPRRAHCQRPSLKGSSRDLGVLIPYSGRIWLLLIGNWISNMVALRLGGLRLAVH
jgi:hypothetical protein